MSFLNDRVMHRLMGRSKWQRLQWIVGDLFLILYFLTDNVPPLILLKALKWAGEVSGERRWKIGAVSPPNLWLDLVEVRFPLFAKWARPGFSAEAIKSHFAPPSAPHYQSDAVLQAGEGDGMSAAALPVGTSGCITSQRSDSETAWMSLRQLSWAVRHWGRLNKVFDSITKSLETDVTYSFHRWSFILRSDALLQRPD